MGWDQWEIGRVFLPLPLIFGIAMYRHCYGCLVVVVFTLLFNLLDSLDVDHARLQEMMLMSSSPMTPLPTKWDPML